MTGRTIILGIITILVVIYGACDLLRNRSKHLNITGKSLMINKTGASIPKNTGFTQSALPGGDAPDIQKQKLHGNSNQKEKFVISHPEIDKLPQLADLTPVQRRVIDARWGRDPFTRMDSDWKNKAELQKNTSKPDRLYQEFALNGIVRLSGRMIAIINNKTYHVGDLLSEWRIEKIEKDHVVMQKDYEQVVLFLPGQEDFR